MNDDLNIVIGSALCTLIITLVSGYFSLQWAIKLQKNIYNHKAKLKAYSKLIGYRIVLSQLYVSRYEAFIFSDYHEFCWKLQGSPEESFQKSEAIRWMHRSEDLVLEISRTSQELFETVALIRVLFKQTPELIELTNDIYNIKTLKINQRPDSAWALEQLRDWKSKAVLNVQNLVEKCVKDTINNLSSYLDNELR